MRFSLPKGRVDLKHHAKRGARHAKKHWKTLFVWAVGGLFVFSGLFFLWAATLKLPDLSSLDDRKIEQSLKIYDRTGSVLLYDLHDNVQRTVVPLSQISSNVQHATVAIEDPGFYEHGGIDPKAILRAVISHLTFGLILPLSGGSTITQQVIKGTVLTTDQTIARKFKEWILALKLDQTMSKDQILELYLNQAPYGGAIYGVEQASETFFNKHASDLSVAEAAYLAAVLPAPTYYSPYGNHKDALDARKNLVLDKMLEHGYLTQEEHDAAEAQVVEFQPQRDQSIQAPHFVFYVRQYLEDKYGPDALEENGWKVTTTLDADLQTHAEEIVKENALSNTDKFNASNAGLIAIDPKTGQILSMVGSRNYFDTQIDGNFNVTLAARQPGSTFKPFAYAESFLKGYTPDTVVFDVHTQFQTTCAADNYTSDGDCYSPVNYDGQFRGPMTFRDALAQSINVPAIKVLYLAGLSDTLRLAKAMGISTLGDANQYGLTLVLGGGEVTLLDMTSAYGVFADNGVRVSPTAVLKVEDTQGNVIEDNTQPQGSQVLPAFAAQEINDILSDRVARAPLGENDLFNFGGREVAVKTGTTNNYRDAWTIGYTPDIVVGIWAGNNDNSSMVKKVSGFIVGPMWSQFMNYALTKLPVSSFSRTEVDESNLKPVLRGVWQGDNTLVQNNIEYVTQSVHDILYWVDKGNPNGPVPSDPSTDPQFNLWETPVRAWAFANGYTDGALVPVGPAPGSQTFGTTTQPAF